MLNWLPTYFDSLKYPAGTQSLILTLGYGLAFVLGLLVARVADGTMHTHTHARTPTHAHIQAKISALTLPQP